MACGKCGEICKCGEEVRTPGHSTGEETRTPEIKQPATAPLRKDEGEDIEMSKCSGRKHTPIVSEAQRRLFGAVAGGNAKLAPGLSKKEAKRHLKEVAGEGLPEKVSSKKCEMSIKPEEMDIKKKKIINVFKKVQSTIAPMNLASKKMKCLKKANFNLSIAKGELIIEKL